MAQIQINDLSDASVVVDFEFHIVSSNTWTTSSGDTSILGVDSGTWDSQGNDKQLIINSSDKQIGFLRMNLDKSPTTDPFQLLSVGDGDDGLLVKDNGNITWTLIAK